MVVKTTEAIQTLYESDETAWLDTMADLIREGKIHQLDYGHLQEYLTDMAQRDRSEVKSRLVTLLVHLLKWSYQPESRTRRWSSTILDQRSELQDLLESVVLRQHAMDVLTTAYGTALKRAQIETGMPNESFPSDCPYTLEQILTQELQAE